MVPQKNPKPTPQKNSNTALIVGGIVIFVLLLVGLAWYLLSSDSTPSPTPTPPSPPSTEDEGSGDDVIDDDDDDGTQTNDKKVNCKKAFNKNCSFLTLPSQKATCCYQQSEEGSCTLKSCGIEPVTTDGYCCSIDPANDSQVGVCAMNTSSKVCNNQPGCQWSTTPCSTTPTPTTTGACCTNEKLSDSNCSLHDNDQSACDNTYLNNRSGCKWYGSGCDDKEWCIPLNGNDAEECKARSTENSCNNKDGKCQWGKNYVPTNGGSCVVNPKVTNDKGNIAACSSSSTGWPNGKKQKDGCKAIDNKKDCTSPKHENKKKCCEWIPN
jgi:hypothetical protein